MERNLWSIEQTYELPQRYKNYAFSCQHRIFTPRVLLCVDISRDGLGHLFVALISNAKREEKIMLAILAAVFIVLWLFGFLAFHVTSSLIHIALVVGIVLIVLHFLRGRRAAT